MLKQLGFTVTVAVLLSACGGGNDNFYSPQNNSSLASSAPATSSSSAAPVSSASSTATTSRSSTSSSAPVVVTSSSVASSAAVSSVSSSAVVSSVASSSGTNSSAAISSVASSSITSSSVASSSSVVSSSSVASSSSVTSSAVSSAASSSAVSSASGTVVNIDVTQGWRAYGAGTFAYANGVNVSMAAEGDGAVFDLANPISLEGAVVTFVINASNEYKVSGANLQPFAQLKEGSWPGEWDCWTNNSSLTAGADQTITCTIDTPADIFNSATAGAQIGIQAKGTTVTGTVLIKSVKITYPVAGSSSSASSVASSSPSSVAASSASSNSSVASSVASSSSSSSSAAASGLTVNFESNTVGSTVYGVIGYNTDPAATVVTLASVTGLPTNGSSTKVAKVAPTNWDTIPKFQVTIPQGKTLANYKITVDAYFPRATLGYNGDDNYYKDFLLFAGVAITDAAKPGTYPTYFHSSFQTIWNEVDVWKTFEFTPNATKAAALTGTIEIGLGINRPAIGSNNNAYYLDNITLVPVP